MLLGCFFPFFFFFLFFSFFLSWLQGFSFYTALLNLVAAKYIIVVALMIFMHSLTLLVVGNYNYQYLAMSWSVLDHEDFRA